jgi:hypothetical protein
MLKGGFRETVTEESWLTEAQLLKLCARSETPIADAILDDLVHVYMLVRRGLLVPSVGASPGIVALEARVAALEAKVAAGQHAAIDHELRWWQRLAEYRLKLADPSLDEGRRRTLLAVDQLATNELRALGQSPGPSVLEAERDAENARALPAPASPELPEPQGFGKEVHAAALVHLSGNQLAMVRVLGAWCDDRGVVRTTYAQLSEALDVTVETVKALMRKLESKGWIYLIDGPKPSWVLRIMIPDRS